jgi:hypothetical protein
MVSYRRLILLKLCYFLLLSSVRLLRLISNCDCAATAMRERCEFHRSTIAIGNAFIDYTVFIPLSQHRCVIAASHAHRSRSWKLSFSDDVTKLSFAISRSKSDTAVAALNACHSIVYPNIFTMLKILATLPISSCEPERIFRRLSIL